MVNPCIPERGIAELDWVLERGAKVVLLRPGPVAGTRGTRSPFLPAFDAFWKRIEESGVLVAMHASDSGYQRHANEWEGDGRDMTPFAPRPFTDAVNTRTADQRHRDLGDLPRDAEPVPRRSAC